MKAIESISNSGSVTKQNWFTLHPLAAFFTLAILFSWLIALPSLFFGLPFKPFQTIGAYGPFLAGLLASAASGREEMKSFFRRMTNFHFGLSLYLLAIFGYVLLYFLVASLSGAPLVQYLTEKWTLIFSLYLPALFTVYLVNPIGEETGWTGFALPHLQKRFSPWLAAVILGLIWAIWHLPAYFVPSEMGTFNPIGFIIFILVAIFTRLLWTWLSNHAHGSGILAILLHASSNAVSLTLIPQMLPTPTQSQLVTSGMIMLGFLFLFAILTLIFTRGQLSFESTTETS